MAKTQDSSLQPTTQPSTSQPTAVTTPPTQPITPPPAATTPPAATPKTPRRRTATTTPAPPATQPTAAQPTPAAPQTQEKRRATPRIPAWVWISVILVGAGAVIATLAFVAPSFVWKSAKSFTAPIQTAPAMPAAPGQQVTQTQIVSNAGYNIVGDIVISGMNIREDKLRELLNQQTSVAEGEDVYRHLLINGRVPDRFVERMKQVLTPQFFAQNTGEMSVVFNLDVNGTTRRVRVKTGDFMITLAYFLAVRNSPGVIFRAGEPQAEASGFYNTDVFPRNVIFTVGDTIVGTPYNFVPLAAFKQPSDATVGNLKLPEVNTNRATPKVRSGNLPPSQPAYPNAP